MSSFSTVNTLHLYATNMDISSNLISETIQVQNIRPKTTDQPVNILTSGTNKTVNIGNSTSAINIYGNVLLSGGTFHMRGYFNQLS